MTNHDDLRVSPDPALAEDLRQRLHARLASAQRPGVTPSADNDPTDHEGDLIMLETTDRPVDHEPPTTGRSPSRWLMVAAAAAAIALVGTLIVAAGDDDERKIDTAGTTPTTVPARDIDEVDGAVEPGRYVIDPDHDPSTPLVATFEVAAEGWSPFLGVYKQVRNNDARMTDVHIVTIVNLARHACTDHRPADPPVGPSVDDLANALAALEPFEVSIPPTDVTLLGYEGKRVQLTMPLDDIASCQDGYLSSWRVPQGDFNAYAAEPGWTEDFWILDVNGQRLVITSNQGPATTAEELAERDAIFDSIRIQP